MIDKIIHGAVLISAYAVAWFLMFFCLLPVGLGAVDPETGTPLNARLKQKALIAAIVAAVLWVGFYALIRTGRLVL